MSSDCENKDADVDTKLSIDEFDEIVGDIDEYKKWLVQYPEQMDKIFARAIELGLTDEIVDLFIKHGLEIDAFGAYHKGALYNPLLYACYLQYPDSIAVLLKYGANPHIITGGIDNPISVLLTANELNRDEESIERGLKLLLDHYARRKMTASAMERIKSPGTSGGTFVYKSRYIRDFLANVKIVERL